MKGDFLGFSFDGMHCSQLGITHVSSSDRYDEDLFPEVRDKTVEVPNSHGEYYYGSTYGTRTFEINIAYDSITETQFRNIRRLFGTRKVCELIFDERPYKVYYAKIESPIEMSYVCFDEQKRTEDSSRNGIRRDREHDQEYMPGGQIVDNVVVPAGEELKFKLTRIPNDTPTLEETEVESSYNSTTYTYTFTNNTENDIEVTITYNTNEIPYAPAWEQITPWKYEYDEGGRPIKQRIYKGEGTINLICYQPFAHQLFKIKELYEEVGSGAGNTFTKYDNVDEWIESSGILTREKWNTYHIDQVISAGAPYTYAIPVYNPGDLNVGFCLYIPFSTVETLIDTQETVTVSASSTIEYAIKHLPAQNISVTGVSSYEVSEDNKKITLVNNELTKTEATISYTYTKYTQEILPKGENFDIIINGDTETLVLKPIKQKNKKDTGVLINTRTHLIEGVSFAQVADQNDYRKPAWEKTGSLYNEYIEIGEFPYIKRNDWRLDTKFNRSQSIKISCAAVDGIRIYYDYLYF